MISLHCTQCKQLLEMDEAFAGGVCRCSHCGTIQTVPSNPKTGGGGKGQKPASNKALYKKSRGMPAGGAGQVGTGLDELAEIVASSGLSRGSLTRPAPKTDRPGRSGAAPEAQATATLKSNPMFPLLIAAGGVVVVLLALVLYFALRPAAPRGPAMATGSAPPNLPADADAPDEPTPAPAPAGPSFAGVPLPAGPVVYLIDRSQANEEILDTLKAAAYASARSLGPGRTFQIILWDRIGEGVVAYPPDVPALATTDEIDAASKALEDEVAYGSTDLKPTLEKALKYRPAAIVLATAKGFTLEEQNVPMVQAATQGRPVRIHTFSLGKVDSNVLKQIAQQTGGQYRELGYKQLDAYAR